MRGLRLHRVARSSRRARPRAWNARGLGRHARAVEHVERGAEALGQLRRAARRAGVERADHADRPAPSGAATRGGRPGRPPRGAGSRRRSPGPRPPGGTRRAAAATRPCEPTSAVPAPPRTARMPAHRPGDDPALVVGRERVHARLAARCRSPRTRRRGRRRPRPCETSSRAASRASAPPLRAMRWMRSPKRIGRPPARSRIAAMRSAIRSGGSPHIRYVSATRAARALGRLAGAAQVQGPGKRSRRASASSPRRA